MVNAVALGLRHGFDWDHLAAILDIVNTSAVDKGAPKRSLRPLVGALMYALGHAMAVAILGLCALYFAAILPRWIDPLMERMVGLNRSIQKAQRQKGKRGRQSIPDNK